MCIHSTILQLLADISGQMGHAPSNVRRNLLFFKKKQILGQIGQLLMLCICKTAFSFSGFAPQHRPLDTSGGSAPDPCYKFVLLASCAPQKGGLESANVFIFEPASQVLTTCQSLSPPMRIFFASVSLSIGIS